MSTDIERSVERKAFAVVMDRFSRMAGLEPADKAVAYALGFGAQAYSERKRRGTIPYAEIIAYAETHRLDLHAIFFGAPAAAAPAPAAPTPPVMISVADAAALVAEVVRQRLNGPAAPTRMDSEGCTCQGNVLAELTALAFDGDNLALLATVTGRPAVAVRRLIDEGVAAQRRRAATAAGARCHDTNPQDDDDVSGGAA